MTNLEFEKLPALLPRKLFLAATGLTKDGLAKLIAGARTHKYWHVQAAAIRQARKIPPCPTTFA